MSNDLSSNNLPHAPLHSCLSNPLLISLPSFLPIPLRLTLNLLFRSLSIDPSSDNNDITPRVIDDFSRGSVLLAHFVAFDVQSYTWSQDQKVLILIVDSAVGRVNLMDSLHGDKSHNEPVTPMSSRHLDRLFCIFACGEVVLARHLGEEKETSAEGETDGREAGDDTVSGDGVSIRDVGPVGNMVDTGGVLEGDGVA